MKEFLDYKRTVFKKRKKNIETQVQFHVISDPLRFSIKRVKFQHSNKRQSGCVCGENSIAIRII